MRPYIVGISVRLRLLELAGESFYPMQQRLGFSIKAHVSCLTHARIQAGSNDGLTGLCHRTCSSSVERCYKRMNGDSVSATYEVYDLIPSRVSFHIFFLKCETLYYIDPAFLGCVGRQGKGFYII